MRSTLPANFYVVAHEAGAEHPALPTWANRSLNPAELAERYPLDTIMRKELLDVPGGFQLLNMLSPQECAQLIQVSEQLGYHKDAAVSLPRAIRHNDNVVWVTDEQTDSIIWRRVAQLVERDLTISAAKKPLGLNARFRFYRYSVGDFFKFHSDGAWPGSRVIDEQLVADAYPDRFSMMTFLIFLNDDFAGGATRFLVNADDSGKPARRDARVRQVDVRTSTGGALCFPHGAHPLHCIHSGEAVTRGTKYIIRTDILYEL
jgi:predicted 2-oxoglutarate/Fe(II)-dependent dioxygenase YbiX